MHLLRGLVSACLIAGCSIGPTGGSDADVLGTFGGSGKSDGTDVWEVLHDDATGETIYRGIDYSNADDPFIFAEQVYAELEPGIYQYISTFPGQASSVFAFVDPEQDGAADLATLDVLPLNTDVDLTLAQLETLYNDSIGSGGESEGKADLTSGSSCGWHWFRLGGALGAAAGTCSWSWAGGPWLAGIVCGGSVIAVAYEGISGSCSTPTPSGQSSSGTVNTPTPSPSPRVFPAPPPAPPPAMRRPMDPRRSVGPSEGVRNGQPVPYPREYRRRSDQQGYRP